MQYTELSPESLEEWNKEIKEDTASNKLKATLSTTYFARNYLGIVGYQWQHVFWKKIDRQIKRIIGCTPRQVGKSLACAVLALKATLFNSYPAGVANKTFVGIVSATDEQSMKLMGEIKNLIRLGDTYISDVTNGKVKSWFSDQVDYSIEAENNKTTITFKNGNIIRCLPPTDRIRGYSFSYVFVDEAAFIDNEDVYFNCIKPTISKTDGFIIVTSTPNGQSGFFYELFDPEDKYKEHEFERIWVSPYSIEDTKWMAQFEKDRVHYSDTGRDREFRQERMAEFTAQVSAFFANEDVEKGIDKELVREEKSSQVTHMGIDFGMSNSNTVISIVKRDKEIVKLVWQYIYPNGSDGELMRDIKSLMKDYSVEKIIVDDCPEGYYIIKEMQKEGMPMTAMKFRTEKVAKYVSFRSMLRKGKIKYYDNEELIRQMKAMQEIQNPVSTKIEKPTGGKDDAVDSFLLACYHYLDEEGIFESFIVMPANMTEQELIDELEIWGGKIENKK